jgi:hypothetical protein
MLLEDKENNRESGANISATGRLYRTRDSLLPTALILGGYKERGIVCYQHLFYRDVLMNKGESAANISAAGRLQRTRDSLTPTSLQFIENKRVSVVYISATRRLQ